jgi:hypothetical protein
MEECTLEWYEENSLFFRMNQTEIFAIDQTAPQHGDWSNSIYFFLEKKRLKYYDDINHPFPMRFQNLEEFPYIKCTHRCFLNGTYLERMPTIIREIEVLINSRKPTDTPFMQWLGERGFAFQCYNINDNNEDVWEIVMPFPLLLRPGFWEITNIQNGD